MGAAEGLQVRTAIPEAQALAAELLRAAVMPRTAAIDAAHVAIVMLLGLGFLVTWNCTLHRWPCRYQTMRR
jgi:hypothetical protein